MSIRPSVVSPYLNPSKITDPKTVAEAHGMALALYRIATHNLELRIRLAMRSKRNVFQLRQRCAQSSLISAPIPAQDSLRNLMQNLPNAITRKGSVSSHFVALLEQTGNYS